MVKKVKSIISKASRIAEGYRRSTDRRWPLGLLVNMEEYYHLQPKDMRRLLHHRRKIQKGNGSLFVYEWPHIKGEKTSISSINDIQKDLDMVVLKNNRLGKRDIHVFRVNNPRNN